MARDVTLTLDEGMRFRARTGTGHELLLDASGDAGGVNAGPRPTELVLVALGSCGAMDVVSILRKMRQEVTAYEVSAHGETASEHPKRYVRIELVHRLTGPALSEANVRRAIHLSMSRYCPVFALLAPAVPIAVRYEIRETADGIMSSGEVRLEEAEAAP
jgi:putative redox protein